MWHQLFFDLFDPAVSPPSTQVFTCIIASQLLMCNRFTTKRIAYTKKSEPLILERSEIQILFSRVLAKLKTVRHIFLIYFDQRL